MMKGCPPVNQLDGRMNEPVIYLDLDETLFHTCWNADGTGDKDRHWFKLDSVWYGSMLRPIAHELVDFCKEQNRVRVLTNSDFDYASYLVSHFTFGIPVEDIVSRHDYVEYVRDGGGGWMCDPREIAVLKTVINEPNAILIDNLYPDDPGAVMKMQYLGIDESRYIQIKDFHGRPFAVTLENMELTKIQNKIKALL